MSGPRPSISVPLRSARRAAQMIVGGVLALGLGVFVLLLPVIGDGSAANDVLAIAFGIVLLLLGAGILGGWWVGRAATALVVDAESVRWQSTRRPWQLRWDELSRVAMRVGWHPARGWGKNWMVHLELVLREPSLAAKHPELEHLRKPFTGGGPDRYGVPFAQRRELIAPIDAALREFAGERYAGVIDDGRLAPGIGYQPREL